MNFSRDYYAGGLAGLGLGAIVTRYAVWQGLIAPIWHPLVVIPGFALIAIGSSLARRGKRQTPRPNAEPAPNSGAPAA